MRRPTLYILLPLLTVLMSSLAAVPTYAEPVAKPKQIRNAYSCGIVTPNEYPVVLIKFGAGYWTDKKGKRTHPCSSAKKTYHPTLGKFTAKVRWYAGKKVIWARTITVENKARPSPALDFNSEYLWLEGNNRLSYDDKPFKITVTISRPGHRSYVLVRDRFAYNYD